MSTKKRKDGDAKSRAKISPERFAQALVHDETSNYEANLAAGYSEQNARRGKRCASKACWLEVEKQNALKAKHLQKLGVSFDPKGLEALSLGRLASNVIEGKDKAVASAKLLGQHRSVDCFGPEKGIDGYFVLQMPASLAARVRPCPTPEHPHAFTLQPLSKELRPGKESEIEGAPIESKDQNGFSE